MAYAVGQIVWIDIPTKGPHPAVVALCLPDGYIILNGTGTLEDESPIVTLSAAAARRCGLSKETQFYGSSKFVWYWKPQSDVSSSESIAEFPSYLAAIRAAALGVLQAFALPMLEVQKLPEHCGLSLSDLKAIKTAIANH